MANYKEAERDAIKSLQEKLHDLDLDDEQSLPANMIRWLRARDMNVAKAEDMFRTSMEWRKENKIELILDWTPPQVLLTTIPFEICGYDDTGCPICIYQSKYFDLHALLNLDKTENILYNVYNSERILEASKSRSKVREAVFIYDLEGLNILQMMHPRNLEMSREITQIIEANYPELVKAVYVINTPAPWLFKFFWTMIKQFLPPRTIEKIHLYGSNREKWTADILSAVPGDQLPPFYGGTNEAFAHIA